MRSVGRSILVLVVSAVTLSAPGADPSVAIGGSAAVNPPVVPPQTNDGPIRFVDLSNASGGPIDFGNPRSDVEKSTCAFFDADGDGWDDFVTLTGVGISSGYFLNRPVTPAVRGTPADLNGRMFVPAPAGNGLDDGNAFDRDGAAITVGDVDGDGDEDIFIGCGFNDTLPVGSGRNMLLLNDGHGNFTDVAESLEIDDGDNTTAACLFFDMDMDGDLDLLTCNTTFADAGKAGDGLAHLFRNTLAETGELGFIDETSERGIVEKGIAVWAVIATDYDNDGDLDVMISHDIGGPLQLFQNDGFGYFTDVRTSSGSGAGDDARPSTFGDDTPTAMATSMADTDNDGDLDLYVANGGGNSFYVNQGDGTFTQLAASKGVRGGTVAWGTSFADFDIDGHIDLYVSGGDFWDLARPQVRSWMFRNLGDGTFTDVWGGGGFRHDVPLHRENGTATADFDRDGLPDMLVTRAERAGASPYLYHNVSAAAGRHWTELKLIGSGVGTNTSAIGAKVRVFPRDQSGERIPGVAYLREVEGGDGRASRASLDQHVGLGADAVTFDVEVEWPRAGDLASRRAFFQRLPVDVRIEIPEVPRAEAWRLAPEGSVFVQAGTETVFRCDAEGEANPLVSVTVESGPPWIGIGPWQDGRTVRVVAPPVTETTEFTATLRAEPQGSPDPPTMQTLTVSVVSVPAVTTVLRGRRGILRVRGGGLAVAGLTYVVDGVTCEIVSSKERTASDGTTEQEIKLRLPRGSRRHPRRTNPEIVITEPVAGFSVAAPF